MRSHGSSVACLSPSEMRLFSASTLRITTSTESPFFTTSDGCCTRFVQDMSEMWISPSMPGSISTKAPKLVRLRTLPFKRVPTGYFSGSIIHGSCSVCFMPSEIFSSFGSTLRSEGAEAREVANLAVQTRADRILLRQHHPRILLRLLHAERDLLLVRIDLAIGRRRSS